MIKCDKDVIVRCGSERSRLGTALRALAILLSVLILTSSPAWAATQLKIGDIVIADGNADSGRGAIIVVDPTTGAQSIISSGQFFIDPVSLAISSDGSIIVCDRALRAILRVDPNTGVQTVISSGGLIDPFGIALDSTGNIFIADTGWDQVTQVNTLGRIMRLDPTTGIQTVISSGGLLSDPWTLAFETTGNLVVSDSTSNVAPFTGQGGIIRINPVTGAQTPVSVFHSGPAGTPGCPFGITTEVGGAIWTTTFTYPDTGTPVYGCVPPAIFRTDPLTGATTTVSAYPTWSWRLPFGIDVDLDGTLLVTDELIAGVFRVNPINGTPTPISIGGFFVSPVDVVVVKSLPTGGGGNSAPVITLVNANPSSFNESSSTTVNVAFTDSNLQDSHTAYINWGDGTAIQQLNLPAGTLTFSATHPYIDDNPTGTSSDSYTISVSVTDSSLSDTDSTIIIVNNVAPMITGVSSPAGTQALGATVSISANFTDAGVQDTHICSVNWGDGATTSGSITETNGSGSCSASHSYSAPGSYSAQVTVTDDDGGSVISSAISVKVNAPTVISSLTATSPINENGSTTVSGVFTDADSSDTHTVTISWNDGSANTVLNLAAGVSSFSANHQYVDDNPTGTSSDSYTISATVTDPVMSSDTKTTSTTVNNVAPSITGVSAPSGTQSVGASLSFGANFTDTGVQDTHVCSVNWGDGATTSGSVTESNGSGSCTASHSFTTAGTYSVRVTVTDDDGGSVISSPSSVVVNAATATTSLTATSPINENGSTTVTGAFADPVSTHTHTVTINWHDGSPNTVINLAAGVLNYSTSHQYLDDNPTATSSDVYGITVTVADSAGGSDTDTVNVTVNNVAPSITGVTAPSGTQPLGTPISISANFTDAGTRDTHVCSVNWGDGATTSGSVTETNGSGSCSAAHTYSTAGTYSIRVTVTDDDGGSVISSPVSVTVNSPTAITSLTATGPINENGSTTLTGNFTDADVADTHSVTITWADGTANTVLNLAAGIRTFSASHTYLDDNPTATPSDNYAIAVVVADNHGSSASGSTSVNVKNVAPVISSITGPTVPVTLGSSVTITANFTDVGSQDTHTCTFAWGDAQANTTVTAAGTGNGSCSASHTYSANGLYVVTATVKDDDTGTVSGTYPAISVQSAVTPSKIVFMSTRDGNAEIYSMNADGTGVTRLTNNSATDAFPVWSPDRTRILFTSTRSGGPELYVMNANGSNVVRLTTNCKVNGLASWGSNGKIAFTSDRDGNLEVYSMNADGSSQIRLTNNSAADAAPVFSPDGTKIAFTSSRDGNFEIYSMNANGSGVTRLTNNSATEMNPDWSPDGTKIAFASNRDGSSNFEIYTMSANGSGAIRLTNNAAIDVEPTWSADGTKILFTTNRISSTNSEIYVMNANGTNVIRLTNNSALDSSADW